MASTDNADHVGLSRGIPARFPLRVVSMEMVRATPLALVVLAIRKALGTLGIRFCVGERHLLIPGTRSRANRARDKQCPVDGALGSNGHLGFLRRLKLCGLVTAMQCASSLPVPSTRSPPCGTDNCARSQPVLRFAATRTPVGFELRPEHRSGAQRSIRPATLHGCA